MSLVHSLIGAAVGAVTGYVLHDPIKKTKDKALDATIGHPVERVVQGVRNRVAEWRDRRAPAVHGKDVAAAAELNVETSKYPKSVREVVAKALAQKYLAEDDIEDKVLIISGTGEEVKVEVLDQDAAKDQ